MFRKLVSRSLIICLGVALQMPNLPAQEAAVSPLNRGKTEAERSRDFISYLVTAKPKNGNFPKEAMPYYAARLERGQDLPGTLATIDRMLDATLKAKQDPFNLHACMHAYLAHREKFSAPMMQKVRQFAAAWDYTKSIGVSLNYELMRDGAGYLAAQEWPDLKDKAGNPAAKIRELCGKRLMKQFSETCARNASEYDAPVYYGTDFAPARMVAEFCKDPVLSQAAGMTLDFMLIHTGAHWHDGYHTSSAGRGKYWGSLNLSPHAASPTNGMGFLLFGATQPFNLASAPQAYWLAHPGKWPSRQLLTRWQASLPEERTVLGSHLWPSHRQMVRKMAWFTKGYGLASQREDESPFNSFLFKECRRTMLKWISAKPASTFTILQENRRRPQEQIRNAFAYGENPYCQVMQHQGTLLGVHDVPAEYGFWVTRAPFTTTGAIVLRKEKDGWVFCHGGSMLFAFRFLQASSWDKPNTRESLDLLKCDAPRGGWILETSALKPFAGGGPEAELQKFSDAVLARCKVDNQTSASPPKVSFKNLNGRTLSLVWKPLVEPLAGQCLVDGKPLEYGKFPQLQTNGVLQHPNGSMSLTVGELTRTYDFKKWKISDQKVAR